MSPEIDLLHSKINLGRVGEPRCKACAILVDTGDYLKILRVVPDILSADKAFGYFVSFLQLSLEQKNLGHEVLVFCKGKKDGIEYINGIRVYRVKSPHFFPFLSLQQKLRKFVKKNFSNALHETIVHSHDRNALFFSYVKKRPQHIVHLHGLPLPFFAKYRKLNPTSIRGFSYNLRVHYLYKFALKKADAIISYSRDLASLLECYRIPDEKIYIVPNGVSETFFRQVNLDERATMLRRLGLDFGDKIILFIGRLKWIKGVYHILHAMPHIIERHPSAKLLIVGGGEVSDLENIKRTLSALKVENHVTLLPHVPHSITPYYYSISNVHVAISLAPGYSKTMLESLASSTPVVALRNVDTEEILCKNNCGLVVEEGTPSEIASEVDYLLSNPNVARGMGAKGRRMIRGEYTWGRCAERIDIIYNRLLR